jgi:hypothetical protein
VEPGQEAPDGKRFLAIEPVEGEEETVPLTVVVNWLADRDG